MHHKHAQKYAKSPATSGEIPLGRAVPYLEKESPLSPSCGEEDFDRLRQECQDHPDLLPYTFYEYLRRMLETIQSEEDTEERPRRATLGEVARAADVPYDFAKEAQANGLIRPDGGRGTRRKRYRLKLASWLKKLHVLNEAGYSWEALRTWTGRRFQPGHEHERRWPEGFEGSPTESS